MARKQSLLNLAAISATLSLELLTLPLLPTKVQAHSSGGTLLSQAFEAPNQKAPPTTAGAGVRGMACVSGKLPLTALMPAQAMPLTVMESPTLFWYVPESTAQEAKLVLMDEARKQVLYQTTLPLPKQPGIASFTLPTTTALKVGQPYYWSLVLVCDPEDSGANPIAEGWIERTEPSQTLATQLQKVSDRGRPAAYASAGIWYEALKSLVDLRRQSPNDATLAADWEKLLTSVGLGPLVQQPLVDCCQAKN